METVLDMWSVTWGDDRYPAPELRRPRLQGRVRNDHGTFQAGKRVLTSPIAQIDGRVITTKSGSLYRLGRVDPEYRKLLARNNYPFDRNNPIRLVDRYTQLVF